MKRIFHLWEVEAEVNGEQLCGSYLIIAGSAEVAAKRVRTLIRKQKHSGRVRFTKIKSRGTMDYIPAISKPYWQIEEVA